MTTPTAPVTDFAAYADQINAQVADRAAAVAAGGFGTRNDRGRWTNADGCEIFGTDGIDMTAGQAAVFSYRELPWHGLGKVVSEAPDADTALCLGGLDWNVDLRPVFFGADAESKMGMSRVAGKFATVRTDTEASLGVVGSRYVPLQNIAGFRFLTELVDNAAATFETAGALDQGRRTFLSMLLPEDVVLDAEGAADVIKVYLMAVNSHDGSSPFSVAVTPIRPVCSNTVRWATTGAMSRWTVRHTESATQQVEEAQRTLRLSVNYLKRFREDATAMIQAPMSDAEFDRFAAKMFPIDEDASKVTTTRRTTQREQAIHLFREADTQANIRNTVWGAEQALFEQIDWLSAVKTPKSLRADLVRGARIVEGTTDDRKSIIHRQLLTLTNR